MEDVEKKTEYKAKELGENIKEMSVDMRIFSLTMRSLYAEKAVGTNDELATRFRKLRDETRNDAMVYLKGILPICTKFLDPLLLLSVNLTLPFLAPIPANFLASIIHSKVDLFANVGENIKI